MIKVLMRAVVALFITFTCRSAAAGPSGPVPGDIGFDPRLGRSVPLDIEFIDETGRAVRLDDYFRPRRPVILALAYYECPMLCTMVLNGLVRSLKPLAMTVGSEFEVVVVSFDPRETPELARAKKISYIGLYGRPAAEQGYHFLTGSEASIRALADAVGFRYVYDPIGRQFAHAAGIMVLTPEGRVARYLYGIEFAPRDVKLALVEAADGAIGGLTDRLLLLCFYYDPERGKYGALALGSIRIGGVLTVIILCASIFAMSRRRPTGPGPRDGGLR